MAPAVMVKMKGTPSPTKIIAAPTTSPQMHVARRDPFHLDDPQYDTDRLPEFATLSTMCLSKVDVAEQVKKEKRLADEKKWKARQKGVAEEKKQDKAYLKTLRDIELERVQKRVVAKATAYAEYEKEVFEKTNKDVAARMAKEAQEEAWAKMGEDHKQEFAGNDQNRWTLESQQNDEWQERKRTEQETASNDMRVAEAAKAEAQLKAEKALARRIKGEMTAETKKQHETENKKQDQKDKDGQAGRKANIDYANNITRLHWTPPPSPIHITQYAKELRDGATPKALEGKF